MFSSRNCGFFPAEIAVFSRAETTAFSSAQPPPANVLQAGSSIILIGAINTFPGVKTRPGSGKFGILDAPVGAAALETRRTQKNPISSGFFGISPRRDGGGGDKKIGNCRKIGISLRGRERLCALGGSAALHRLRPREFAQISPLSSRNGGSCLICPRPHP